MTDKATSVEMDVSGNWHVPGFITITNVSRPGSGEDEFVVSNQATGRNFLANSASVRFFEALRETGQVALAMRSAAIPDNLASPLIKRLIESGMIVRAGQTRSEAQKVKAPLDSRVIMIRWDMLDIRRLTERLRWLGRLLYSPFGYALWGIAMIAMVYVLLDNRDKAALTLRQVWGADAYHWIVFALIFVGLKVVHEMGHALAFREMMRQEQHETGPVRVGICIFAFTPFPFTDVTAAWRLRSTARRVMIGAGGIYFETWAMALLTLIWAQTSAGMFQTVALQVAVVSGALALLFNLNPAVKLDGYFMLTDALRLPNLASRASLAARNFVARLMGASTPSPAPGLLGYWLLSYLYRWTIFAGIFWVLYRLDPRLAPIAALIVALTLILRPMLATARFVHKSDARPAQALVVSSLVGLLIAALFVPFENRLLMNGHIQQFETRLVTATQGGLLTRDGDMWQIQSPDLTHLISDLRLYGDLLDNAQRASFAQAQEQARITTQRQANTTAIARLEQQQSQLRINASNSTWTDRGALSFDGAWVSPTTQTLGALSNPVDAHLTMSFAETALLQTDQLTPGTKVDVRPVSDPTCQFHAILQTGADDVVALNGQVSLRAEPQDASDACFTKHAHGTSIVARARMPNASLAERGWRRLTQLLQNRLPV